MIGTFYSIQVMCVTVFSVCVCVFVCVCACVLRESVVRVIVCVFLCDYNHIHVHVCFDVCLFWSIQKHCTELTFKTCLSKCQYFRKCFSFSVISRMRSNLLGLLFHSFYFSFWLHPLNEALKTKQNERAKQTDDCWIKYPPALSQAKFNMRQISRNAMMYNSRKDTNGMANTRRLQM